MSMLLKLFGGGSTAATASRAIAKDRLSVILASQRGSELLEGVNLEELQRDVLKVVQVRGFCLHSCRWVNPLSSHVCLFTSCYCL
jgi:hypothetical protein